MTAENDQPQRLDLSAEQAARLGWFVAAFFTPEGVWDEDAQRHGPGYVSRCIEDRVSKLITPPGITGQS